MGILHKTKQTTILMQVGTDASGTYVQDDFEGDFVETPQGEDEITSTAISGFSEVIDTSASDYIMTGIAKVSKNRFPLWARAAFGASSTGTGAGVWQEFSGTGTALDTDFTFENVQTGTGTGAGFKIAYTDANVKMTNITGTDKGIIKFNYQIKASANNRKLYYRTEDLT